MLTPDNHARLATLTTQKTITPDDVKFITFLIRGNSYVYDGLCKWIYPVDDAGYPTPDGIWYKHPIKRMSRGGTSPDPNSLTSTAPWMDEGVSRSYWYARKGQQARTTALLASLPLEMRENEKLGLKLHAVLAMVARVYKRDVNELWVKVCGILN